jgi:hypothetical protein
MNEQFNNQSFPFPNFEAFKKANSDGSVLLELRDIGTATEWLLHKGKHCHTIWYVTGLILSWIPVAVILVFLIVMWFKNRLLLMTLPLLLISIPLSSPYHRRAFAKARTLFIYIIIGGFFYFLFINPSIWVWVFGGMIGNFLSLWFYRKYAVTCFFIAVADHEDLLMEAYRTNDISLKFTKGPNNGI